MDKGELSIAEANVQMAELGVRVVNEAQRRDVEARQTQFQGQQVQQAAWQNSLNMLNENLQQDRAVRTAPDLLHRSPVRILEVWWRCY